MTIEQLTWKSIHGTERIAAHRTDTIETKHFVMTEVPLSLATCDDFNVASQCLTELAQGPLTLTTQNTCKRLRILVDRLAVEVAREMLGS